jgi:hypothetical protein
MFFNAIQKLKNLLRQKYEKYNLFELMYLLHKSDLIPAEDGYGYAHTYILNKKAIIDTFVDNKLDIEFDDVDGIVDVSYQSNHMFRVQGNNIKWKLQKIIRQTYNIVILSERHAIVNNNNNKHIMEIHTGDIIKIENKEYGIFMRLYQFLSQKNIYEDDDRYDTMCVIIENFETDEQKEYSAQELIDLFENEDVTFIKSHQFNWLNAEKQKKS